MKRRATTPADSDRCNLGAALGRSLEALRKKRGLTITALAKMMGVGRTTVYRYFDGEVARIEPFTTLFMGIGEDADEFLKRGRQLSEPTGIGLRHQGAQRLVEALNAAEMARLVSLVEDAKEAGLLDLYMELAEFLQKRLAHPPRS